MVSGVRGDQTASIACHVFSSPRCTAPAQEGQEEVQGGARGWCVRILGWKRSACTATLPRRAQNASRWRRRQQG